MPEGDTIFRAAQTLHTFMVGRLVTRFESVYPALTRIAEDRPVVGRTIDSVSSRGKHLLFMFSGDLVLRTHLRMNGSWHIYRPGESWQRPRHEMRVLIATKSFEAIGFNVPVAEFLRPREEARHDDLRLMGPDLLGNEFEAEEPSVGSERAGSSTSPRRSSISGSSRGPATSTSRKCSSCAASIRLLPSVMSPTTR